jgi:autotransporter family porin
MNKNHRIVWSESRQAYVVAHEAASSRGKPSSTRKAVASAVVMTLAALGSASALAQACPTANGSGLITVNSPVNGSDPFINTSYGCSVGVGQSLTVATGGSINGMAEGVKLPVNGTVGVITNNGNIYGGIYGIDANRVAATSIINNGTISADRTGINIPIGSTITSINNSGTIAGNSTSYSLGIYVSNNSTVDSITNSGTISGKTNSVLVASGGTTGTVNNIFITGDNTAKFSGEVDAPNTPVTVNTGATYTMDNNQLFKVSNFTNAGTLKIGAASTATVTGNFTNTGTFSSTVSDTAFGKLNVSGTATLGGVLAVDASTMTAGRTLGNSLSGVITAGTVTGTFASFSDNSTLFDFTPSYTATSVNLTIAAAGPSTPACSAASSGVITVGASSEVGACSLQNVHLIVEAGGKISGGTEGILVGAGSASRTITNSGSISGTAASISLGRESALSTLTNEIGGSISGGTYGVNLAGDSYSGSGRGRQYTTQINDFQNRGAISGTDTGIRFEKAYASVYNLSGGTISGGNYGINLVNDAKAVINNAGTISGGATGASIGISGAQTYINQIYNTGTINGALSGIESTGGEIDNLFNVIENGSAGILSGSSFGINLVDTKISRGLKNSGTISGGDVGIRASGTTNIDAITNSGVITGASNSVFVANGATLTRLTIEGNNTAEFNGKVDAPNTDVSVSNGGIYTMKDGQDFTVKSFKNNGTLKIGAGSTATVTGNFTNTGTFSPTVSDTAFGKLVVTGTADINRGTLSVDASTMTAGRTTGNTLGGIITANSIVGKFYYVNDTSTLFDFKPVYSNTSVDLTVVAGTTPPSACPAASNGLITVSGSSVVASCNFSVNGSLNVDAGGTITGVSTPNGVNVATGVTLNSITNNGTIYGPSVGVATTNASTITSLENTGSIVGGEFGIRVGNRSTVTGITNSGTIAGDISSVLVSPISPAIQIPFGPLLPEAPAGTLGNIFIAGNNTAKFIGKVDAPNTPVTVNSGATYTMDNGQSFIVSRFTNAGALKIGAGNTATVTGDFTNTGTFSPTVTDAATGKLVVTGAANLGGTLDVDATAMTARRAVSSIITAGSISGTFATTTTNSALFDFTPVYTATSVDLTVAAASGPRPGTGTTPGSGSVPGTGTPVSNSLVEQIVRSAGNTPALGAANVLGQIFASDPNGAVSAFFVPLTSDAAVNDAVTQTLPLLTSGSQGAAGAALGAMSRVVQARIESNRGLSSGDTFYGDKNVWLKPFGSWADQDDRNGASGYKANTSGLAFGVDATVSDTTRLGVSLAYAAASADSKSNAAPTRAKVDVYQLLGYGSYSLDPTTEVSYQAGIGHNKNKGQRDIKFAGTTAASSFNSSVTTLGAGVGRNYKLSDTTAFTPSVRGDYTRIKDKAYTESGAGALNLNVAGRATDELILAVDGKLTHQYAAGSTVTANLGVGYDAINKQGSVTAAFVGAPGLAFSTQGIDQSPWLVRGGVGIATKTQSGIELSARFDVEYRKDFLNQTASVKARWAF